jgi:Signal transduction histidine kinase
MDALPRQVAGDREFAAGAARALTAVLADLRRTEMRPPEDETAAHVGSGDVFRLRWAPTLGRVDRLSRQLLAYAGRQSLVPEALGLTSFLSNLANALRSTLDVGIELFVDIGDDCLQCYVDASALEEALLTLVVNGRDAMPSGGRLQLTATAETVSDGSKGVALSICDSGHGMPDEFMMRAKRPFVTSKTYDPWAGMGLAAADGFARQSDGRLTLRARTGGGVCVTLHLPQFPHVGTAPQLLAPDHQEESQRLSHELSQLDTGASVAARAGRGERLLREVPE